MSFRNIPVFFFSLVQPKKKKHSAENFISFIVTWLFQNNVNHQRGRQFVGFRMQRNRGWPQRIHWGPSCVMAPTRETSVLSLWSGPKELLCRVSRKLCGHYSLARTLRREKPKVCGMRTAVLFFMSQLLCSCWEILMCLLNGQFSLDSTWTSPPWPGSEYLPLLSPLANKHKFHFCL